ncbi:MAG: glutamine-hydrolyzing GMP synthase [Acidobacteria bacterium]|nr:MAG: glutamine-hydrolyzing GMP synthase [Acidobacteriota bacterium]MCE7958382.1 glutamine-hydrolyzing GMP synthase [Acidobacteria bacterium ACB2]
MSRSHDTVVVLDFGSQYTQVIARRIREARVRSVVLPCTASPEEIRAASPKGIVLSGGPSSVYDPGAPEGDPALLDLGLPVLGLCYGMQLMARRLGGDVGRAEGREYGRAQVRVSDGRLFSGLSPSQTVWMSHGDHVVSPPPGFRVTAETANAPVAAFESEERRLYGLQFHPEVHHTEHGAEMLENFLYDVCGARADWTMSGFRQETVARLREEVRGGVVLGALSGGVDSTVAAVLLREAVGERFRGVFVDTGLLRKDEARSVMEAFRRIGLPVGAVDAGARFLAALSGLTDPERKRKVIGGLFIDVFTENARQVDGAAWLMQGTLYPDVIESVSIKGPSAVIKTHHNVGGLPERLGFRLVEPLRELFKDEVRRLGEELGIPREMLYRHPFPGPGLAVRMPGEITADRVRILQEADAIFLEELRAAGWYETTAQAFAVLLPVRTVGVMGDQRTYESVVALRAVTTQDFMTADWARLPHDLLDRAARRIVGEVRGVNRVVYDVTSKPPGTIEWE